MVRQPSVWDGLIWILAMSIELDSMTQTTPANSCCNYRKWNRQNNIFLVESSDQSILFWYYSLSGLLSLVVVAEEVSYIPKLERKLLFSCVIKWSTWKVPSSANCKEILIQVVECNLSILYTNCSSINQFSSLAIKSENNEDSNPILQEDITLGETWNI